MRRFLCTLFLGLSLLAVGCAHAVTPETSFNETKMISLTEAAKELDLSVSEGEFWGDRYVHSEERDEFFIRSGKDFYTFNGMSRQVEYPGIQYENREIMIPKGMYNSMCKDLGRTDKLMSDFHKVDVNDDYQIKRASDVNRDEPVVESKPYIAPAPAKAAEPKPEPVKASGSLKGKKIVIDAGHGGKDPGAVVGDRYEKHIALAVSTRLQKLLEAEGAEVIMTRTDNDTYPELSERAGLANTVKADLFISVHANAAGSAAANGIETFYGGSGDRRTQSQRAAKLVNDAMVNATGANDRHDKAETRGLHVLKHTKMPAILVECGFMTNPGELKKMFEDSYRDKLAEGIHKGVVSFLGDRASVSK